MKTLKMLTALMILTGLTACDSRSAADFKEERSDRLYQSAMADYSAGRLEAAISGFEKVLRESPKNSSARFQLACLLQDSKHDYLGAVCNYREFLLMAPESDKAKMAKERMAICERFLAEELAKKMNLSGNRELAEEGSRARKELEESEAERTKLVSSLEETKAKLTAATRENERLRQLGGAIGDEKVEPAKARTITTKDLLDEEEAVTDKKELADAKSLEAAAAKEDAESGSSSKILPTQAADAKEKRKAFEDAKKAEKAEQEKKLAAIPDTYVVQEGDTLYKIANRFYGKTSAWKKIREANKEVISVDGRVRVGRTIKLPK